MLKVAPNEARPSDRKNLGFAPAEQQRRVAAEISVLKVHSEPSALANCTAPAASETQVGSHSALASCTDPAASEVGSHDKPSALANSTDPAASGDHHDATESSDILAAIASSGQACAHAAGVAGPSDWAQALVEAVEEASISSELSQMKRDSKGNGLPSYWHDVVIHLNGRSFMSSAQRLSRGLPAETCIDNLVTTE